MYNSHNTGYNTTPCNIRIVCSVPIYYAHIYIYTNIRVVRAEKVFKYMRRNKAIKVLHFLNSHVSRRWFRRRLKQLFLYELSRIVVHFIYLYIRLLIMRRGGSIRWTRETAAVVPGQTLRDVPKLWLNISYRCLNDERLNADS